MNKKFIKAIISLVIFMLGISHVFVLFRFVCNDMFEGVLWGVAIALLLTGLICFILPYAKQDEQDRIKKVRFIGKIICTILGGVLFVVDSVVFIEDVIVTILLLLSVIFAYLGTILLCSCLNQNNLNK